MVGSVDSEPWQIPIKMGVKNSEKMMLNMNMLTAGWWDDGANGTVGGCETGLAFEGL